MTNSSSACVTLLLGAALLAIAMPVAAQVTQVSGSAQSGEGGLWLAPALRKPDTSTPSSGKALREEVERKFEKQFQRADVANRGAITRDEANTGRMGFVAAHFDEIDTARRGTVTFADVRLFLRARQGLF